MDNLRYKVDDNFVLSEDNLDILISLKYQRIQEQIEQNKEVDNKFGIVLEY